MLGHVCYKQSIRKHMLPCHTRPYSTTVRAHVRIYHQAMPSCRSNVKSQPASHMPPPACNSVEGEFTQVGGSHRGHAATGDCTLLQRKKPSRKATRAIGSKCTTR